MSEFWVVLKETQPEHESYEEAAAERERLQRYMPGTAFRVHRCKRFRQKADHFPKLVALLREIMEQGVTAELRNRAIVILSTIRNRSGDTPNLTQNFNVPEFDPKRRT